MVVSICRSASRAVAAAARRRPSACIPFPAFKQVIVEAAAQPGLLGCGIVLTVGYAPWPVSWQSEP